MSFTGVFFVHEFNVVEFDSNVSLKGVVYPPAITEFKVYVESVPSKLVTVSATEYFPGVLYVIVIGLITDDDGVPPGKYHLRDVGLPEELSVKLMDVPLQTALVVWVNDATGG